MDVNILSVLVVAQQRLAVLPAVEATNLAKRRRHDTLERVGLAITKICTLDVSGLDLAAVVDDGACWIDEGLTIQLDMACRKVRGKW